MIEYLVYTDGAYSSLRNQGGIGIIFLKNNKLVAKYSKAFKNTTNNRMELLAVIIALESIHCLDKITIYSDSMYVIGCATGKWSKSKNKDLWDRYDKIIQKLNCKIDFVHIRGHQDNEYNNLCDELAVFASNLI